MIRNLKDDLKWYSEQNLNITFKLIAKNVLSTSENKEIISITKLAKTCCTTPSSITRFCIKLGYTGYKELLIELKSDKKSSARGNDVKNKGYSNDSLFWNTYTRVQNSLNSINEHSYNNIINISNTILKSKTIIIIYSNEFKISSEFLHSNLLNLGFLSIQFELINIKNIELINELDSPEICFFILNSDFISISNILENIRNKKHSEICIITNETIDLDDHIFSKNTLIIPNFKNILENKNDMELNLVYLIIQILAHLEYYKIK